MLHTLAFLKIGLSHYIPYDYTHQAYTYLYKFSYFLKSIISKIYFKTAYPCPFNF